MKIRSNNSVEDAGKKLFYVDGKRLIVDSIRFDEDLIRPDPCMHAILSCHIRDVLIGMKHCSSVGALLLTIPIHNSSNSNSNGNNEV